MSLSIVWLLHLTISIMLFIYINQVKSVLPYLNLQKHYLTYINLQIKKTYRLTNCYQRYKANLILTWIFIYQKRVNLFIKRFELKRKSYNILKFILNSTLLLVLLLWMIYLTISKTYLAIFVKENMLLRYFKSWNRRS